MRADAAIILDADDFNIIIAQKGLIHFQVKIFGKKAHGAYPDKGINAIEIASKIIQALDAYRFSYKRHPLLKKPTINIGTIAGGDKVNIVAVARRIKKYGVPFMRGRVQVWIRFCFSHNLPCVVD